MKFRNYLSNCSLLCFVYLFFSGCLALCLWLFHVPASLFFVWFVLQTFLGSFLLLFPYFQKKGFYQHMIDSLQELDQKQLLFELLQEPSFLEGKLCYEVLVETDRAYQEMLKQEKNKSKELKEYMELWLHEVKIPLSSAILTVYQMKDPNPSLRQSLSKIESNLEQVLYYVRSETAEKDYYIQEISLQTVVSNVLKKNKVLFFDSTVEFRLENLEKMVKTDGKWLEFMINQIIQNSFKYRNGPLKILIRAKLERGIVVLELEDNGIGIPASDLPRVFEKSFTGQNGRIVASSTGMGLYLCQQLCHQLGHQIVVSSKEGEGTIVMVRFPRNAYYDVFE